MPEVPYRFDQTHLARELQEKYAGLEPGAETGDTVSVAGRVMLRREMGKLTFATLADSSGAIQLFANAGWTERFDEFSALPLGTWVGAKGEVATTRKGELSVKVAEWVVLAQPLEGRSFGDKWRGVTDTDLRYRQRYVDLWANDETRRAFVLRSRLLSFMRRWLEERGFVEVETPIFHPIPGGAHARPFTTHHNALDVELYLRIAPELYLKRLVVGGFEKVFEIGRVFRNEGLSPRHNPEFTMLELYWAYADYRDMMELVETLVSSAAEELTGSTSLTYQDRPLDLTPPWRRATMSELIEEQIGVRVDVDMSVEDLRRIAEEHGVALEDGWGPGKLVLEIYEKTTEHAIWGPVF
ncbi:MAG: lysine--tRNA ligase, partial [Acidimicrobiia bacterium]